MFLNSDRGYLNLKDSQSIGFDSVRKAGKPARESLMDKLLLPLGVVLPLLALAAELNTHWCARHFFDPFPNGILVSLFALIPISNFMVFLTRKFDLGAYCGPMLLWNGMASGIALIYVLMFLPVTPTFLWAAVFGVGMLGLAPMFSLLTLHHSGKIALSVAQANSPFFNPLQLQRLGHVLIIAGIFCLEFSSTSTRVALHMAASHDRDQQVQGLNMLRQFGNREVMLRACYEHSGRATDILGTFYDMAEPLSVEQARSLYYRVTGRPFNSVPIPESARATLNHAGVTDATGLNAEAKDEFDFDPDIAGQTVSGMARGLSVSDSKINVTVDSRSLTASIDWTMDFRNSSDLDKELRAKILLPQDAVVTGASIIVNGKELPATALVKEEARAVYTANVLHKKDPMLVSSCGADRVLMQCYPIRKNLKLSARLRLAVPLALAARTPDKAHFQLPCFEERNFQVEVGKENEVDVRADRPITVNKNTATTLVQRSPMQISGSLSSAEIAKGADVFSVEIVPQILAQKTFCAAFSNGVPVDAQVVEVSPLHPEHIAFVIDGSACMEPLIQEIATAIGSVPQGCGIDVFFAGDKLEQLARAAQGAQLKESCHLLSLKKCEGGQDCTEALSAAFKNQQSYGGPVIWIHGAQPVLSPEAAEVLRARLNSSNVPILYDMQVSSGPVELFNHLETWLSVNRIDRTGSPGEDLRTLFAVWSGDLHAFKVIRTQGQSHAVEQIYPDVVKLWINDMIQQRLWWANFRHGNINGVLDVPLAMARQFGLITPLTSLVVVPNDTVIPPSPAPEAASSSSDNSSDKSQSMQLVEEYGNSLVALLPQEFRSNATRQRIFSDASPTSSNNFRGEIVSVFSEEIPGSNSAWGVPGCAPASGVTNAASLVESVDSTGSRGVEAAQCIEWSDGPTVAPPVTLSAEETSPKAVSACKKVSKLIDSEGFKGKCTIAESVHPVADSSASDDRAVGAPSAEDKVKLENPLCQLQVLSKTEISKDTISAACNYPRATSQQMIQHQETSKQGFGLAGETFWEQFKGPLLTMIFTWVAVLCVWSRRRAEMPPVRFSLNETANAEKLRAAQANQAKK